MGTGEVSWGMPGAGSPAQPAPPAVLWGRRAELAEAINQRHENPDYLPGVTLTSALRATCDPAAALAGADLVVLARPPPTPPPDPARWAGPLPPPPPPPPPVKGAEARPNPR